MFDWATFRVIVARAGRVALRTTDVLLVVVRADEVPRVAGDMVLRAVPAVRAALRAVVVVRETVFLVVVRADVVRTSDVDVGAVRDTVVFSVVRVALVPSRTAASETPMHNKNPVMKYVNRFIP